MLYDIADAQVRVTLARTVKSLGARVLSPRDQTDIIPSMELSRALSLIRETASPLKKQLIAAAVISDLMRQRDASEPVVLGGVALAYYSREVYATADLDLACADRENLDAVLCAMGFERQGRYWISLDNEATR